MTHGSTMFNPFFVVVLNQFDQTNDTTMALANSSAMGTSRALQAPPRYAPKRCPQQLSPQQNGEFSHYKLLVYGLNIVTVAQNGAPFGAR